jgi:hypothetical protein
MNTYLCNVIYYFENAIHPAGGKAELQKSKRTSGKSTFLGQASPDSSNIRAAVRANNNVRRNPAP